VLFDHENGRFKSTVTKKNGTIVKEEGNIKPIIAATFPILEAAKANELLESGKVIGNVVLLAPELL